MKLQIFINGVDTEYEEINIWKSITTVTDTFTTLLKGKEFNYKIDDTILIKSDSCTLFKGVIETLEQVLSADEGSIILGGRSKQWAFMDFFCVDTKQFKIGTSLASIIGTYGFPTKNDTPNVIQEDLTFFVGDSLAENCRSIALQNDRFLIDTDVIEIAKQGTSSAIEDIKFFNSVEIVNTRQHKKFTVFGTDNYLITGKHRYEMQNSSGGGKPHQVLLNENSEYSNTATGLQKRVKRLEELLIFTVNVMKYDINQKVTNSHTNDLRNIREVETKVNKDTYYQKVTLEKLI